MKANLLHSARRTAASLFAAGLLAAGSASAQPAPTWDRILDAARKEGKVVLYTNTVPPVSQRIAADFAKAYPDIKIEFTRLVGAQMNTTLTQERQSAVDGGDVVLTNETLWLEDRARENALLPVSALPAFKGWPARHIIGNTIPTLSLEPFAMLYNKQLVKTPITGYQDLLRPEFKGRIGTSNLASTLVIAWYDWLEKSQGGDYLAKLRAQGPKIYVGPPPVAQAVASGEVAVGAFVNQQTLQTMIMAGAPIAMVTPSPALAYPYQLAALGWSKRPNAALVLVDYLMTRDGQTVLNGMDGSPSPLADIPGAAKVPDNVVFWDPDQYPAEVAAKYRDYWSRTFN